MTTQTTAHEKLEEIAHELDRGHIGASDAAQAIRRVAEALAGTTPNTRAAMGHIRTDWDW